LIFSLIFLIKSGYSTVKVDYLPGLANEFVSNGNLELNLLLLSFHE